MEQQRASLGRFPLMMDLTGPEHDEAFELMHASFLLQVDALEKTINIMKQDEQENRTGRIHRYVRFVDPMGYTLLHGAVKVSHVEATKYLIERGADLSVKNPEGLTALHIASEGRCIETVRLLVANSGASKEIKDDYGYTALERACRRGIPQVVKVLLQYGCSVAARANIDDGPLICATKNDPERAIPIVLLLINAGANIHHRNMIGNTVLISAVEKLCQAVKNHVDARKKSAFLYLCSLLIHRGCRVNARNNGMETALLVAVREGEESIIKKLIIHKGDLNVRDVDHNTPLFYAFNKGNERLVDLLINCGANPRVHSWQSFRTKNNAKKNALINFIIHKSKQCSTLKNLSKRAIWKHCTNTKRLNLPTRLMKYINLEDC